MHTKLTAADVARGLQAPALDVTGFRAEDRSAVIEQIAGLSPDDHREIAVAANRLVERIGTFDGMTGEVFADLPDQPGRPAGLLPMLALLVTVPQVQAASAARGISPDHAGNGLRDLGQQVAVHRQTFGEFGLHTQGWLTTAWSGGLMWLGRLQFNLLPAGRLPGATRDWVLSTHIPQDGSLRPELVDESFELAREFFAEHFADHPVGEFHCDSWLLDPQLAQVLAPGSNMAAFQRRWQLVGQGVPADDDAMFFVFHRRAPWPELGSLPRDTSLQRAILDRWADGGHWYRWAGLVPLVPAG